MGKEEQTEERDVLNCIFPDEIQDVSESEYQILVNLDAAGKDGMEPENLQIILDVKYPPEYPDDPPVLDIRRSQNATEHPFFSVARDSENLLNSLTEVINENMGMAMIFAIVSTLKENAEQLIADRQKEWEQEQDKKLMEKEREENNKFHGTPVTPQSFAAWRECFIEEMQMKKKKMEALEELAEKKKGKVKDPTPLFTGKQLWLKGIVGKIDEEEGPEVDIQY